MPSASAPRPRPTATLPSLSSTSIEAIKRRLDADQQKLAQIREASRQREASGEALRMRLELRQLVREHRATREPCVISLSKPSQWP
jgi:regulator of protease activity HflC (stomatin/prohibitin superfamily)